MKKLNSVLRVSGKSLKLFALVGTAVVVGAVSTAVVRAAIPSSTNVISGCYKTSTGSLKVIDAEAGQACTTSETALNWSQSASLVSGQVYSGRLEIPLGDLGGQTLLALPGFGDFKATACIGDGDTGITFTNTSSLRVDLPPHSDVLPGQTTPNITPSGVSTFIAGQGSGASAKVASVVISSQSPDGINGCRYQIVATMK